MPPSQNQRQTSKSKQKGTAATAETQVQRPRTRAWVKEEAQRQKPVKSPTETAPVLGVTNTLQPTVGPTSGTVAGKGRRTRPPGTDRKALEKRKPETQAFVFSERDQEIPVAAAQSSIVDRPGESASRPSVVPLWLSGVSFPSTKSPNSNFPSAPLFTSFQTDVQIDMDSSSSASKTSALTGDDISTIKGGGQKRDKALSWEKLRVRRVSKIPAPDKKSEDVRSNMRSGPLQVKFKDVIELRTILQNFVEECKRSRPNKDSYQAVETLFNDINAWKPSCRLATITNRDFDLDVTQCKSSNEAIIQRTVMLSIIDRGQLQQLFDYNCEGQWKLKTSHLLPTTGRMQGVPLPKPDLALFFKLSTLTGARAYAPYPREIGDCLCPDGDERCFPFFFIEVKKAGSDLEAAFRANLHSASQALYNIFVWMSQAEQQDDFFNDVRVFSMDLNAQEINLRMHRAIFDDENCLSFHFDDLLSIQNYDRDQACQIVRDILVEYAGKKLYSLLQSTFKEVSRQEQMLGQVEATQQQSKRKADLTAGQASKRSRSRVGSAVPAVPAPTVSDAASSSFGASGLSLNTDPA